MYNQLNISLAPGEQIYFASDLHLGEPTYEASRAREKKFLTWLDSIKSDAKALFLVGDTFDFWFEYNTVVPKGYIRFLSKIIELQDNGTDVYIFTGNHDIWIFDYLEKELGVKVYRKQLELTANGKQIFIAHGDGLGPKDYKFKMLKKVFTNPFCIWLFKWLHPDIGIKIANLWSRRSRTGHSEDKRIPIEDEWLVAYSKRKLESKHYDFFLYGHRHLPSEYMLSETSKYINLGDWIVNDTYAIFDGENLDLKKYNYEVE